MDVKQCYVVLEDVSLREVVPCWEDVEHPSLGVPHDDLTLAQEEQAEARLTGEVPCRAAHIRTLYSLLGKCRGQLPQCVFVYGHAGTGKSLVLGKVLAALRYRHAFVDCLQCYQPKLIYLSILTKLTGLDAEELPFPCDDVLDLVTALRTLAAQEEDETFVIVLDRCERMRGAGVLRTVLPALSRLRELSGVNVCVVMVSTVTPDKFYSPKGYFETIPLHFTQYTKEETYEILCLERDCTLFRNYVSLFLGVFYSSCRNLHELKYMVNATFEGRLVQQDGEGEVSMRRLWQVEGPRLGASLANLYRRTQHSGGGGGGVPGQDPESVLSLVELPYLSKFFVVASYLASYVPSKMDRAIFLKLSSKKRKRKGGPLRSRGDVLSDTLLGPSAFTADRLAAIFYSIVQGSGDGHSVSFTVNLAVQISFLVKLRLLTSVNGCLDCPKYKCAVGLDFVKTVARSVGFDVLRFLFPK